MRSLFVTSASIGLSDEQLMEQPEAGALFKVELPISGPQPYRFKGAF